MAATPLTGRHLQTFRSLFHLVDAWPKFVPNFGLALACPPAICTRRGKPATKGKRTSTPYNGLMGSENYVRRSHCPHARPREPTNTCAGSLDSPSQPLNETPAPVRQLRTPGRWCRLECGKPFRWPPVFSVLGTYQLSF